MSGNIRDGVACTLRRLILILCPPCLTDINWYTSPHPLHLSIYLSVYLPNCLSACLPVCLPTCLPAWLYANIFVHTNPPFLTFLKYSHTLPSPLPPTNRTYGGRQLQLAMISLPLCCTLRASVPQHAVSFSPLLMSPLLMLPLLSILFSPLLSSPHVSSPLAFSFVYPYLMSPLLPILSSLSSHLLFSPYVSLPIYLFTFPFQELCTVICVTIFLFSTTMLSLLLFFLHFFKSFDCSLRI